MASWGQAESNSYTKSSLVMIEIFPKYYWFILHTNKNVVLSYTF